MDRSTPVHAVPEQLPGFSGVLLPWHDGSAAQPPCSSSAPAKPNRCSVCIIWLYGYYFTHAIPCSKVSNELRIGLASNAFVSSKMSQVQWTLQCTERRSCCFDSWVPRFRKATITSAEKCISPSSKQLQQQHDITTAQKVTGASRCKSVQQKGHKGL